MLELCFRLQSLVGAKKRSARPTVIEEEAGPRTHMAVQEGKDEVRVARVGTRKGMAKKGMAESSIAWCHTCQPQPVHGSATARLDQITLNNTPSQAQAAAKKKEKKRRAEARKEAAFPPSRLLNLSPPSERGTPLPSLPYTALRWGPRERQIYRDEIVRLREGGAGKRKTLQAEMDTPDRAAAPAAARAEVTPAAAPSSSSALSVGLLFRVACLPSRFLRLAVPFRPPGNWIRGSGGNGKPAPEPDGIGRFFCYFFSFFGGLNLSVRPCFGSGGSDGNFFPKSSRGKS
jgi:hypothetical protein